jgi:hypothetical protein
MGKKSSPAVPDYQAAAQAQGQANLEATRAGSKLSNPNYITPYGNRTVTYGNGPPVFDDAAYNAALQSYQQNLQRYNQPRGNNPKGANSRGPTPIAPNREDYFSATGDQDVPTVTETLSPEAQKLYDQQLRISGNLGNLSEQNLGRLDEIYSQPFDFQSASDARNSAEEALIGRLNPYLERDLEGKRTALLQAGIQPGTEAWQREMDDYNRGSNDARLAAITQAGGEQDRQVALAAFLRNLPLNEVNALRTGVQVQSPTFPGFSGSNVQAPDLLGATNAQYNAQLGATNAKNAQSAGLYGGLAGLGGAFLGSPWAGGILGF